MGKGLVETTFEAGPNDDLLVVDVYDKGGSSIVNSYQKKDGEAIDTLDSINGENDSGGTEPESDESSPMESPDSPEYSQSEVARMLSDGNSDIFGFLTDLSSGAAGKFGLNIGTINTITAIINGVSKALNTSYSASDIKNIAGIANALSNGGYQSTIKDKKALDTLVTSTVKTGAEIGLPGVFSKIASNPSHDKAVLAVAAKQAIEATVDKGDTSVFLDVITTEYVTGLETQYPAIIKDVLSNAVRPTDLSEQNYAEFYDTVTGGFEKINEEWNKVYRDNNRTQSTVSETKNSFIDETLEAYVLNIPLDIKFNSDVSYNSAVDVQFADVRLGPVFRAIYGATLDNDFINEKINEWLDPINSSLREKRKESFMALVSKQFKIRTIEEDFKYHFPLEIPNLNREITAI